MIATLDPHVGIEEQCDGYVRYCSDDGRRWEVHGVCDDNRACMVGAVVDGVLVESVEQARLLPTPELDCPVGPGFSGCCDLRITVLDPQTPIGSASAVFGNLRQFPSMFRRLWFALGCSRHFRARRGGLRGVRSRFVPSMHFGEMSAARTDLEILQAIVLPVVVDVMNYIPGRDGPMGTLPHQAMLENK